MTVTLEGEKQVLDTLTNTPPKIIKRFWQLAAQFADKELLNNIKPHSKTGRLERNAYVDVEDNGIELGIRNQGMMVDSKGGRVNYALFVEKGTKPHIIKPKKKKALRWVGGSGFIFAKEVHHPGYKGDPFLRRSADNTFKNLNKLFNKAIGDVT